MLPELLQVIEVIPDTTVHCNVETVNSEEKVSVTISPLTKNSPNVSCISPSSPWLFDNETTDVGVMYKTLV
jgi:hypothetical protein